MRKSVFIGIGVLLLTSCSLFNGNNLIFLDITDANALIIQNGAISRLISDSSSRGIYDGGQLFKSVQGYIESVNGKDDSGKKIASEDITFFAIENLNSTWMIAQLDCGIGPQTYLIEVLTGNTFCLSDYITYDYFNYTEIYGDKSGYYCYGSDLFIAGYPSQEGSNGNSIYHVDLSNPSAIEVDQAVDLTQNVFWGFIATEEGAIYYDEFISNTLGSRRMLKFPNGSLKVLEGYPLSNGFVLGEDIAYCDYGKISLIDINGNTCTIVDYSIAGLGAITMRPKIIGDKLIVNSGSQFIDLTDFRNGNTNSYTTEFTTIERWAKINSNTIGIYGFKNGNTALGCFDLLTGITTFYYQNGEYIINNMKSLDNNVVMGGYLAASGQRVMITYDGTNLTSIMTGSNSGSVIITPIK